MNYALIKNEIVENVIVADAAFIDTIKNDWDDIVDITGTEYGVGWMYKSGVFSQIVAEPVIKQDTWVITTNAFQKRFPKAANGISTKYDLMTLFLTDTGYATSLGVTVDTLYALRSMLITGSNRLNSVASVDLQSPDTVSYINMVTNTVFPEVFRLTKEEAESILKTPAAENEIPKTTRATV